MIMPWSARAWRPCCDAIQILRKSRRHPPARKRCPCLPRSVAAGGNCFAAELESPAAQSALSARELEVIRHLGRGLSNYDLGRVLGVSEHTIKSHLKAIFGKLGVADRAEAVARAYELGLV